MSRKALNRESEKKPSKEYESLQEVLLYAAKHCPEKGATYIDAAGHETFISYPEMLSQALTWLKSLQDMGLKQGDMLLAEIVEPKEYHRLFWACVFGGIVLAPIPQPTSWSLGSEAILTLERIWKKLDKPMMIIQSIHSEYVDSLKKDSSFQGLNYIVTEELLSGKPGENIQERPEDTAYIQFSSGTTGDPKGTMLTYENIRCSCYSIAVGIQMGKDDPVFSWLPHTHNLGIFVPFVSAMMLTNDLYYMLPGTCIRNPLLFLKKISEHKGAWFCTNNFGIDWLTSQIPEQMLGELNLSCVRGIFAGAENISKPVVERFLDKFASCGLNRQVMRPGYGLAEGTVAVTITTRERGYEVQQISRRELMYSGRAVQADPADESDCMSLTGNGPPIGGIVMRIADDDGNTVDEGVIGEVQFQGKCVYKGYYGDPAGFRPNVRDGWLQTGDLGFFRDGVLYIAGRKKDVAVIRGVNYMLTDLEEMIYRKLGLPRGVLAVASIFNTQEQQEEMIVFVENKESLEVFLPLRKAIIKEVNEELGLNLRLVIPVKAIKRTSSGKIQRHAMKTLYESKQYADVEADIRRMTGEERSSSRHAKVPENETQSRIRKCWAKALKLPESEISIDESFAELGGESVQAYWLLGELAEEFDTELDHEIIVLCKTINEMEDYIVDLKREGRCVYQEDQAVKKDMKRQVAITGMAFRLPGAKTQEEFWENLCSKKASINRVSDSRRMLAREPAWDNWMGEMADIDSFDYSFFGMTEEEAVFMDPQQRILLEVTHEALTDAGMITDNSDEEKQVGVYTGVGVNSYYPMVIDYLRDNGIEKVNPKAALGNMPNITAANISHQYNFVGPVMSIDTACSSFLTALHYGVKAVEDGTISGAVVTGSNIMPSSHIYTLLSKAGIISSTNRSKVFDRDADGSILGEGVVTIYLESLSNALKKRKNIYGVICGSAVNNDGFALSVMAPNPKGQYSVLRQAYHDADVNPSDISYFEAHGTGTKIGDPIEISALSRLYNGDSREQKIPIGSVKTNIGHLLWAAGGAGLIKVLLCMKHKQLVPSLHMENINPLLQMDHSPFRVVSDVEAWETPGNKARLSGITSLGLGGTNAHVIIKEWDAPSTAFTPGKRHLLTLSAKTQRALSEVVGSMRSFLEASGGLSVADLCYTSGKCRKHYEYRAACILTEGQSVIDEIKTDKANKARSDRIRVHLGGISNSGARAEFEVLRSFFEKIRSLTNNITFSSDGGREQILCDALNKQTDWQTASTAYAEYDIESEGEIKHVQELKPVDMTVHIGGKHFSGDTKGGFLCGENREPDEQDMLNMIMELYLKGADIRWDLLYPNGSGQMIQLPAYPFEKNSVWLQNKSISA